MCNLGDNKQMQEDKGLSKSGIEIGKILMDVLSKADNPGITLSGESNEVQNICYGVTYLQRTNMQRVLERGV